MQQGSKTQMPTGTSERRGGTTGSNAVTLQLQLSCTRECKPSVARSAFSREAKKPSFYVKSHYFEMLATN